jgi:hypothetical protein
MNNGTLLRRQWGTLLMEPVEPDCPYKPQSLHLR